MSDKDLIFNLGLINNLHEMGRKQVADICNALEIKVETEEGA